MNCSTRRATWYRRLRCASMIIIVVKSPSTLSLNLIKDTDRDSLSVSSCIVVCAICRSDKYVRQSWYRILSICPVSKIIGCHEKSSHEITCPVSLYLFQRENLEAVARAKRFALFLTLAEVELEQEEKKERERDARLLK